MGNKRRKSATKDNKSSSNFKQYWTELQNDKVQKTIFKKSCDKFMRPRVTQNRSVASEVEYLAKDLQLIGCVGLKSLIPSKREINALLSHLRKYNMSRVFIKSILSQHNVNQFINYGCHGNVKNVRLAFTYDVPRQLTICSNPQVLSYPPNQELLIFGLFRSCIPTLNSVPDDIVRMVSCFYNIEGSDEYKFNARNAPWDPIIGFAKLAYCCDENLRPVYYSSYRYRSNRECVAYFRYNGCEADEVYVCLVYVPNGKFFKCRKSQSDPWWKEVEYVGIYRQSQMLPLYHVNLNQDYQVKQGGYV